jgi:hypothetical protein
MTAFVLRQYDLPETSNIELWRLNFGITLVASPRGPVATIGD